MDTQPQAVFVAGEGLPSPYYEDDPKRDTVVTNNMCRPQGLPYALYAKKLWTTGKHDSSGDEVAKKGAVLYGTVHNDADDAFNAAIEKFIESLKPFGIEAKTNSDQGALKKIAEKHLSSSTAVKGASAMKSVFGEKNYPGNIQKLHNHACKLYCSRCWSCSSNLPGPDAVRYCQVAEGEFDASYTENYQSRVDIVVTKLWFHDADCVGQKYETYGDLINRRCGESSGRSDTIAPCQLTEFDFKGVFYGSYDPLVNYINKKFTDPMVDHPPGEPLGFGSKDTYCYDDRCYEYLPSTNLEEVLEYGVHLSTMVRFTYMWVNVNSLSHQFSSYFPDICFPAPPEPPAGARGYGNRFVIGKTLLLTGGHNVPKATSGRTQDTSEQEEFPVVHQLCHARFKDTELKQEEHGHEGRFSVSKNPLLRNRQCSGTIAIPIESRHSLYVETAENLHTIEKGEALFLPGDLKHGCITRAFRAGEAPEWQCSILAHVIADGHPYNYEDGVEVKASLQTYLPPEHIPFIPESNRDRVVDDAAKCLGAILSLEKQQSSGGTKSRDKMKKLLL